jgi:L-ascorbate metabolism protein UlaG (beta-lactamase superfamily)
MPNRRTVIAGMATLAVAASTRPGAAQTSAPLTGDILKTSAGDLVIHPIAHASIVLGYGPHVLYVDPAKHSFAGMPPPTGFLITHAHPDHYDPENLLRLAGKAPIVTTAQVAAELPAALKGQASVLANGQSGTIDGLPVTAIAAYNMTPDRLQYHPKGVGNGYLLTFADKKVYIAGDTEDTPEMRALTGIDVAFLPMNLPFTMTVEQAAAAVKAFRPKVVYPYHYKGTDPRKFADLVGDVAEVRLRDWYPPGSGD